MFGSENQNHYQYEKPTYRLATRNGINYNLDLNDIVDWTVYYGIIEPARITLYKNISPSDIIIDIGGNMGETAMNFGKIVYKGTPQNAIDELHGKIYQKMVSRNELNNYADNYAVISNKMVAGQPLIHIYSDTNPNEGFELVKPNLEDVFFSKINTQNTLV